VLVRPIWTLGGIALVVALVRCGGGAPAVESQERGEPETAPEAASGSDAGPPNAAPPEPARIRRGLGTISARVPGSEAVVEGVRLVSHHVRAVIQDGFARTEIEEEVRNETGRVLEGRYVFPLPPGVSISRLGLWVGNELVEGEIVERDRARRIFRGIVEDTVRPRDPALLERLRGSELSLTIFPLPARGSRKVVLAYDEALRQEGGASTYRLPLSLGADRAVPLGDLAVIVEVVGDRGEPPGDATTPGWDARAEVSGDRLRFEVRVADAVPERDFVVRVAVPPSREARVVTFEEAGERTFAARLTVPPEIGAASVDRRPEDRVLVIDVSDGQSAETLAVEARLAASIARATAAGGRFALLACDSACEAYPADGLTEPTPAALDAAQAFLDALGPRGSSDLSGAVRAGAARLGGDRRGQLVVLHDGNASAGELSTATIASRVAGALGPSRIDLRFLGVGRALDEAQLRGLAEALGAAYEPLTVSDPRDPHLAEIARGLDRPLVTRPRIELPRGFVEVRPSTLPSLRLGEPITLVGKLDGAPEAGVARLTGAVDGEPIAVEVPLHVDASAPRNPLLPRLFAEREMEEIEAAGGADARARVVAWSKKAHVLSRHTSLLVLENERMFAEFGIARTARRAAELSDHGFGERVADAPTGALGSGVPLSDPLDAAHGALAGSHLASPPQVRMCMTTVSGRLPPEVIQRIVRLQAGRFRACYERGLMKNPQLAGRVLTRFVIDLAGQVASASDAGSDLPDPEVVACVVRGLYSLDFPEPEGGIITVVYPFMFSSDGTRPSAPVTLWPDFPRVPRAPRPRPEDDERSAARGRWSGGLQVTVDVRHGPGDERWREARGEELGALERAVVAAPSSRARRDRWVRALLQAGRFEQAREEGLRFLALDPDLALARELSAQAEAIQGDDRAALTAVDALASANARSADAHLRAVRAFAASGDSRRACAHLRSLAEIEGTKAAREGADHCDAAPTPADAIAAATAATAVRAGVFRVSVECDDPVLRCPEAAVVTPTGRVLSRAAPFATVPHEGGLALLVAGAGTYRTLLHGGDPRARGRVRLDVHGKQAVFPFDGGDLRTVATTRIEEKRHRRPWAWIVN
jgi:Ca-activated chloride channel family protein